MKRSMVHWLNQMIVVEEKKHDELQHLIFSTHSPGLGTQLDMTAARLSALYEAQRVAAKIEEEEHERR